MALTLAADPGRVHCPFVFFFRGQGTRHLGLGTFTPMKSTVRAPLVSGHAGREWTEQQQSVLDAPETWRQKRKRLPMSMLGTRDARGGRAGGRGYKARRREARSSWRGRRTRALGDRDARRRSLAAPRSPQPRSGSDAHGWELRLRRESSSCKAAVAVFGSPAHLRRHCRAWAPRSSGHPSSRHEQPARGDSVAPGTRVWASASATLSGPDAPEAACHSRSRHGHRHHCVPASNITTTTSATTVSAAVVSPAACLAGRFHPSPSALWALTTWRPARRRKGSAPCPSSAGMAAGARQGYLAPEQPLRLPHRSPPPLPPRQLLQSPLLVPREPSAAGGLTWTHWARASAS